MLDRQFGKIIFICDDCDDTLCTDENEFEPARQAFRDAGWKAELVGREWVHLCGACQ